MKSKYEVDHADNKRSPKHETMAIKLLDKYKERLRAGDNPDPRNYMKRYIGPDKNSFRIAMNLITLFVTVANRRKQRWNNMVDSGEVRKTMQRICQRDCARDI